MYMRLNDKKDYSVEDPNFEVFSNSIISIRALSMFIVIIGHTLDQITHTIFPSAQIGVDMFIFLSGFLLSISLLRKENQKNSWISWYRRRTIRIFPSLIISTMVILVFYFLVFEYIFDLNSILIHMSGIQSIPGNPNFFQIMSVHWFITLIISCYLIFPIFYKLIKEKFKQVFITVLIFYGFFILFYDYIYNFSLFLFPFLFNQKFHYDFFIPRYFDFIFGMLVGFWLAKNNLTNLKTLLGNKKTGIISLVIVVFSSVCNITFVLLSSSYNLIALSRTLFAISLIIFNIYFLKTKPRVNKILKVPGKASYEIYLLHIIVILYTIVDPSPLKFLSTLNPLIYLPIILISCIGFAYPFYLLGNWINQERKMHKIVIHVSLSLVIYAIIGYFFSFLIVFEFSDIFSLMLFILIFVYLIFLRLIYILVQEQIGK